MDKKVIAIGVLVLIIGIGGGYAVGKEGGHESEYGRSEHMMSDGSMMGDSSNGGMQGEMDSMTAGLQGKTGDAFDQEFLNEMILHHQGAVQMAEAALKDAKHQEIKDLAQKIITAQNAEIKQMQAWKASWYGSSQAAQ